MTAREDDEKLANDFIVALVDAYGANHREPDCPEPECSVCGARDCPRGEPLHYHHDGCPVCSFSWENP